MKQDTFNSRLAVPQPERASERVTLACYESPSTPPQSALEEVALTGLTEHTLLRLVDIAAARS